MRETLVGEVDGVLELHFDDPLRTHNIRQGVTTFYHYISPRNRDRVHTNHRERIWPKTIEQVKEKHF